MHPQRGEQQQAEDADTEHEQGRDDEGGEVSHRRASRTARIKSPRSHSRSSVTTETVARISSAICSGVFIPRLLLARRLRSDRQPSRPSPTRAPTPGFAAAKAATDVLPTCATS